MTAIEHREIKGITVKNMIVTIFSTVSIVSAVMTAYFNLGRDIHDLRSDQQTEHRINDIRLKMIETRLNVLEQQVKDQKPKS